MTREILKDLLPIMQAFVEGKVIEYYNEDLKAWTLSNNLILDGSYNYRIKPEPKYRPFITKEECWTEMHKHHDFGWVKKINGGYKQIMAIHIDMFNKYCADFAGQTGTACFEFEYLYKNYTFTDGSPFGIKED